MYKKLFLIGIILLLSINVYAGQITKQWTFAPGETVESAKDNNNFDDLFTVINGAIEGGAGGNIAEDTLTEREMADDINPRVRWDEGFRDFTPTGLQPATSGSLISNISAGTAYVEGYRVKKSSAVSHGYTNTKDTYIDISKTGVFTYTEVERGAAAPSVAPNSTRLAVVASEGGALIQVTDLRTPTPYTTGYTIQTVNTQTGAVATGSTTVPFDDTIPQKTEGDQYMSLTITPTNAANKLKIDVVVVGSDSGGGQLTAMLFQDDASDALAATSVYDDTGNYFSLITFTHYMTAATTSATTFKVRAGSNSTGTFTFNGIGSARKYGGVAASSITGTELQP